MDSCGTIDIGGGDGGGRAGDGNGGRSEKRVRLRGLEVGDRGCEDGAGRASVVCGSEVGREWKSESGTTIRRICNA
jgi:hypothetical protein